VGFALEGFPILQVITVSKFKQLKVKKVWLFALAGAMWSGVGVMLCSLAYGWLADLHSMVAVWVGVGALASSLVAYRYGFAHIAEKNITRLHAFFEHVHPLAFISPKSYLLVAFMMALGMTLRSSPIPHVYLAVVYTIIGAALFLSSLHYYPHIWSLARAN
jgi:hypothetical protein